MTEDETFRRLKRPSFNEMFHKAEGTDLPNLVNYLEENSWDYKEYLEMIYDRFPLALGHRSKECYVAEWVHRYEYLKNKP